MGDKYCGLSWNLQQVISSVIMASDEERWGDDFEDDDSEDQENCREQELEEEEQTEQEETAYEQ